MVHYNHLFHGTTEEYVDRAIRNGRGSFRSIDRYTSIPWIGLNFARVYSGRFNSPKAVINLQDVGLDRKIKGEREGSVTSSQGVDLIVDQERIESGEDQKIKGFRVYREEDMEEFIRTFIDPERLNTSMGTLIERFC